jgi:hypothetical protein
VECNVGARIIEVKVVLKKTTKREQRDGERTDSSKAMRAAPDLIKISMKA